jgi:hypothetical protein
MYTMTALARGLLTSVVLTVLLVPIARGAGQRGSAEERVLEAIDALRGHSAEGLNEREKRRLGKRLDAAWDVLIDEKKIAEGMVREVLEREQSDSFLIIDLCGFLLSLDQEDAALEEIAGYLSRVDPNVYSHGFFLAAATMAGGQCEACRPSVLKMLELKELEAHIAMHALRVEIDLGLVFTISAYGDDIIDDVVARLDDPDCAVRGNAARAVGNLLPLRDFPEIRRMAMEDECALARAGAWMGLILLQDPKSEDLVLKRLEHRETLAPMEKQYLPMVLASTGSKSARAHVETLMRDDDPELAKWARKVFSNLHPLQEMDTGRADSRKRRKMQKRLERIARKGYSGRELAGRDLLAALTPDDLPLLNEARAAVLSRLSDECLYDYYPMTFAAAKLRGAALREEGSPP